MRWIVTLIAILFSCTACVVPQQHAPNVVDRAAMGDIERLGSEAQIRARNGDDMCTAEDEIQRLRASMIYLKQPEHLWPMHISHQPYEHRIAVAKSCACSTQGICE